MVCLWLFIDIFWLGYWTRCIPVYRIGISNYKLNLGPVDRDGGGLCYRMKFLFQNFMRERQHTNFNLSEDRLHKQISITAKYCVGTIQYKLFFYYSETEVYTHNCVQTHVQLNYLIKNN